MWDLHYSQVQARSNPTWQACKWPEAKPNQICSISIEVVLLVGVVSKMGPWPRLTKSLPATWWDMVHFIELRPLHHLRGSANIPAVGWPWHLSAARKGHGMARSKFWFALLLKRCDPKQQRPHRSFSMLRIYVIASNFLVLVRHTKSRLRSCPWNRRTAM